MPGLPVPCRNQVALASRGGRAFAGFYAGVLGTVLMRLVDAVLCFPAIFLLLALASLTEPGLLTTTLLIAATAWMSVARVVEAQVHSLREFRDERALARDCAAPCHHACRDQ